MAAAIAPADGAINGLIRSPLPDRGDLPLPNLSKGANLVSQPPGSGECRLKVRSLVRGKTMPRSTLSSIGFAAVAALPLLYAGTASAGAGGGAQGTLLLQEICQLLGMSLCPQVPTITQGVLELAGLQTASPDYVRGPFNLRICSVAGNSDAKPVPTQPCSILALNAVNAPVSSPVAVSDLAGLATLAFTTNKLGQAVPTEPSDPSANSFLYAVTTEVSGEPDALTLVYDNPLQTSFAVGQIVAKISLPLQVLSFTDGGERLVCCGVQGSPASVATLQINASANGGLTAVVTGDFVGNGTQQSHSAAELGLQFPLGSPAVLASTPNSREPHAIFQVSVPLLITGPNNTAKCGKAISTQTSDPADCGNDPAYFGVTPGVATNGSAIGSSTGINQITGLPTAFSSDVLGFTPTFLGQPIGIAPSAAPAGAPPQCVGTSCTPTYTYPFCSSFLVKGVLSSATAAFYSIATDGTTYVSAPRTPPTGFSCPF
jgi:hypothetical protein